MPVQSKRLRPSPATRRRAPGQTSATAVTFGYRRSRAMIVLAIFTLLFGFFWMVNGSFTAGAAVTLFQTTPEWGWCLHLVMSCLELAPIFALPFIGDLPKPIRLVFWLIALPFGIFDVFSSSVGVAPFFLWTHLGPEWSTVQNVILAEIIAFLPEPMLVWLVVGMRNALRG